MQLYGYVWSYHGTGGSTITMQGIVVMWSGSVESIPAGWALCDGADGRPDLRDRFIIGAGSTYAPGDTGGTSEHTHAFATSAHTHTFTAGGNIGAGANINATTTPATLSGITDSVCHNPPYYALCFIIKL
jgi:microcystin-dependent protein